MPASTFSALSDLLIHSQVAVDSDVGVRFGMEAQGLLVKSISYKPTRDTTSKKNHRGMEVIHIKTNPKLVLTVDADITLLAGALAGKHPGAPIHKNYILDFYPDIAHGFSAALGYFIYDDVDTSAPSADLNTGKFSLTWFAPPSGTVQLVSAPSVPV